MKRFRLIILLLGLPLGLWAVSTMAPGRGGAAVPPAALLKHRNPPTTAFIELRRRQAKSARIPFSLRQSWVPLDRISPCLINAVIAAEDSGFYRHRGVEWELTKQVFWEEIKTRGKIRGASTITQQVARNLYLSPDKSYWRKLREIWLARSLEKDLPKRRILEIYLNIAEWGDGVFGAEAAARHYFGKSAADLDWDEAAALTAVLPSPRRHAPTEDSRWVALRVQWVYQRLRVTGRYAVPDPAPALLPPAPAA